MPVLSIIIPTPDGEQLVRVLNSLRGQPLESRDEVIVVGDTHSRPLEEVRRVVAGFGPQYRYFAHDAGMHSWGHPQINFGMGVAMGDFLVFQDDDDVFSPGAFDAIRRRLTTHRPRMFRFMSHRGRIYWRRKGRVRRGHVGGHCIVAPNDPRKLATWTDRYEGDFDFIASTLAMYPPAEVEWCPEIISLARPAHDWWNVETDEDIERLRVLRNSGREWMTGDTRDISREEQRRWWADRNPARLRAYLIAGGRGAGVLSLRDGRWWITVLVAPETRRQGLGTFIYRLLSYAHPPGGVWARIRLDNLASIRAAERAGYRSVEPGLWRFTYD